MGQHRPIRKKHVLIHKQKEKIPFQSQDLEALVRKVKRAYSYSLSNGKRSSFLLRLRYTLSFLSLSWRGAWISEINSDASFGFASQRRTRRSRRHKDDQFRRNNRLGVCHICVRKPQDERAAALRVSPFTLLTCAAGFGDCKTSVSIVNSPSGTTPQDRCLSYQRRQCQRRSNFQRRLHLSSAMQQPNDTLPFDPRARMTDGSII